MTIYNSRGVKVGKAGVGTPGPGQSAKKIKQLKPKQVRAAEKKIEKKHEHEHLVPPDTSVHTVASNAGEIDYKLDRMEWEELGHAKRVKPKPSGDDNLRNKFL